MLTDIGRNRVRRQVIRIQSEGVFNFFCDQLKAGQYIKNEYYYRYDKVVKGKDITHWQRHYEKEDELLNKDTVREGNRGIPDPFTGAGDICKGLQLRVDSDQLFAGELSLAV